MRIGIVGSRKRSSKEDESFVFSIVQKALDEYGHHQLTIVSGGCPVGADAFAERAADYYGVSILVHYPQRHPKPTNKSEAVDRFYIRNKKIANDSDVLYCLVSPDRTGGTENTIKYAIELGKKIYLVMPDGNQVLSKI